MEEFFEVFKENTNMILSGVTTVLAFFFGDFWWLFLAFFILNIVDYLTGWYKARYTQTEKSSIGAHGIAKKVGYWVIIGISFFISVSCIQAGTAIGLDLAFMSMIGYFVLITYIVNEIRSIIENMVVFGVKIPEVLIKGLDITKKLLEDKANIANRKKED